MATTTAYVKRVLNELNKSTSENAQSWKQLIHSNNRAVQTAAYIKKWGGNPRSDTVDATETAVTGESNIHTSIRKKIRGELVPALAPQPAPSKHAIKPSKFREENYKLIWNGTCLFRRNSERAVPISAYESWLQMELWAQKEDNAMAEYDLQSTQANIFAKETNQRLSDQVLFWLMGSERNIQD